jgi:hypothetical protein
MFTTKLRTAIVGLVGALALAVPATAMAVDPLEWQYNPYDHRTAGPVSQPFPNTAYALDDSVHALVYGFSTCFGVALGADLELDASTGTVQQVQWEFIRQASHPQTTAITGTERVALYNRFIGKYLVRAPQSVGINLDWSATPSYEWQFATGTPAYAGLGLTSSELYNTNEQGYLVNPLFTGGLGTPYDCGPGVVWLHAPFSLPAGYQAPPLNAIVGIGYAHWGGGGGS